MKKLTVLWLLVAVQTAVFAQKSPVFSTTEGAIKGYDPVAYFTQKKPVKGQATLTHSWKGAVWHFSTEANRKAFVENPDKYAPAYGGYCAYGWSRGYGVKIEPEAWSIVNNKLYLNYDLDVRDDWNEKQAEYIQKANANYAKAFPKQ
jgi:YHS domain-containing protein